MAFRIKSPREDARLIHYRAKEYDWIREAVMFAWWYPVNACFTDDWFSGDKVVERVNKFSGREKAEKNLIIGVLMVLYIDGYIEMEKEDQYAETKFRPSRKGFNRLQKMHSGPAIKVSW